MSDNRPVPLNKYLDAAVEKNDALIIEALGKLEDPARRGKLKITVASVCQLSGLSRNTVRNRQWALERLKGAKLKFRNGLQEVAVGASERVDDGAILEKMRTRVKRALEQNALLYEEILSLHHIIDGKDKVISALNARKLAPVTFLPRRVNNPNPPKPDLNK